MKLFKQVSNFLGKHEAGIRTGLIVVSTVSAVYFAIKDTPVMMKKLEELDTNGATNAEKVKALAPIAARTVIATGLSVGLTISSGKKAGDKIASLSNAYTLMKTAKEEYETYTKSVVGEEKAEEIKHKINHDRILADAYTGRSEDIIKTGHGNDVFYDHWSGRYFTSDINYIKKVVNDLNYQLMNEMYIGLNELYAELDIPSTACGRELGWNIDYGQIELIFTPELDDCDKAYTIIDFRRAPMSKDTLRRW